ncbi:MAG: NAD(P)/FAD-dependent oxidoreductase [Erysipelotrichaceae bacterium]|nr:NAD(P)/FAD-dependent oxidoreductase [Erysipelotrichaceae bacterium]
MNSNLINNKLEKRFGNKVSAKLNYDNHSIVVSGCLENYEDIVEACYMCVYNKDSWHVVNKIEWSGHQEKPMKVPVLEDKELDNAKPDVLIIGGGVIGCSIARELSKWDIDILLVEKEADLAMQASSRNDGEVHPGVDQSKMNLKLKYELKGNAMYEDVCKQLGVPFRRNGQYVAFKGKYLIPILKIIASQRKKLGIKDTKVINKKELYLANPNLKQGYDVGLYNPSAGTVCPYELTIAYGENAVTNGAKIALNAAVTSMDVIDGKIISVKTNRGTIYPKLVINAAGVFSDKIASMANDEFFSIHPRKGTDVILDNKKQYLTDKILSAKDLFNPDKNTKGGGILRTVDDNILIGPDAYEVFDREDYSTESKNLHAIIDKQKTAIEALDRKDAITYFSGIRAATFEEDFIIEKGRSTNNIIHVAGIQSPGLTATPAIALDVEKMAIDFLGTTKRNDRYNPIREPYKQLRKLSDEERNKLIKENPEYGEIVCRCEQISKGEIIDALSGPIMVPTIDGIKKRVRPGMGRCQGGFCSPLVSKIIADYLNCDIAAVTKKGNNSYISVGKTK